MVYLIDFENTGDSIFNELNSIESDSHLIIFYNESSSKMSVTQHINIEKSAIKREYIKIKSGGKNALDFQLCTYLGFLIAKTDKQEYSIISKDLGFDSVCTFWKSRGITVKRLPTFNPNSAAKATTTTSNSTATDKNVELNKILGTEANAVIKLINKYKTKQTINNTLVKLYGSEKAGEIYRLIKPYIASKN